MAPGSLRLRRPGEQLRRNFDFSSWQSVLATLVGLALFTLIGVGTRLLMMKTIQQRRERMNRQINERLRTLIAAYVRLAQRAVLELVAGRAVHTHELVVSLRAFVREALGLDPIPADLAIPMQGSTRPSGLAGGRRARRAAARVVRWGYGRRRWRRRWNG